MPAGVLVEQSETPAAVLAEQFVMPAAVLAGQSGIPAGTLAVVLMLVELQAKFQIRVGAMKLGAMNLANILLGAKILVMAPARTATVLAATTMLRVPEKKSHLPVSNKKKTIQ